MAASTASYVVDGWSLGDAVYRVVLTVYTVGYDEVRPIDTTDAGDLRPRARSGRPARP